MILQEINKSPVRVSVIPYIAEVLMEINVDRIAAAIILAYESQSTDPIKLTQELLEEDQEFGE